MALTLEVWDGSSWIDKTGSCVSLRRRIRSGGLEELDGELVKDSFSVGQEIRLKEDGVIVFEGVVYEVDRRHRGRDVERCGFKAYDYLIKYDRHIVYRAYPTGTKAGEIIRDLGKLIDDEIPVNLSGVEDGDALLSPWEIQNEKALDVMKSVARGTNYWLRMKPCLSYLSFNRENAYVRIPYIINPAATSFSAFVWFKVPVLPSERGRDFILIQQMDDGGKGRTWLFIRGLDNVIASFLGGVSTLSEVAVQKNALYLAGITYDLDSNTLKIYVNGEMKKSNTVTAEDAYGDHLLGIHKNLASKPFEGYMYGAYFYDRVLSDEKVLQLYQNPQSPLPNGLILWLNFDEGSGSIVYDRSGNDNHGTIYGEATWGYEVYPKVANSLLLEFRPKVIA